MKSWTRTLNLDDAHTLLALAETGSTQLAWKQACHRALPGLSVARRRELIRLVRDGFLAWTEDARVANGVFQQIYNDAPATAQMDLVDLQWALSHPITLIAVEHLVAPIVNQEETEISLNTVETLVAEHLHTNSPESLRKTRTVLLGAMEGIGTLITRGTGQHRSLRASRGTPHPIAFGYLVMRELQERGARGMMASEVPESSLGVRLTQCGESHARYCLEWCLQAGLLHLHGDEIGVA